MSHAYVIEIHGETAGIVVQDPDGYCFFSSLRAFDAIDGAVFKTPKSAEDAALRLEQRPRRRATAIPMGSWPS